MSNVVISKILLYTRKVTLYTIICLVSLYCLPAMAEKNTENSKNTASTTEISPSISEQLDFSKIKPEGTVTEIDGYTVKIVPAKGELKGALLAMQGLNNNLKCLELVAETVIESGYNYYELLLPGNDKNAHSARRKTWIAAARFLNKLANIDRIHHQDGTENYKTVGLGYSTGSAVWLHEIKDSGKASLDSYILLAPPTNLRTKWGILRFVLNPFLWFRSYNLGLKGNVPEELRAHVKTPVWSHHTLLNMIDGLEDKDKFTANFPQADITAILVSLDEFTHIDRAAAFFRAINADFRLVDEDREEKGLYRHLFINPKYGGKNNFKVLTTIIAEKLRSP